MPRDKNIKKVLIIGSGGIKVGQAAEFDYSGSQALKALKEEGIETIILNPNIATIQTSHDMADKVYLEPITPKFVESVIKEEMPDAILLAFGGQTALNTGVALAEKGVLDKYGVKILGTSLEAIKKTEDREEFRKALGKIGARTAPSKSAFSVYEAKAIAKEIGFPVIIRPAYILGGLGSSVAWNKDDLESKVKVGLKQSVIGQVLVEKYLHHWKEIEYEVVRDSEDNCITVCNMENFDPMGVHTGDSIVVAPSQTLTNNEYHMLRSASIRIVRSLGIIGECNIQFALDPKSDKFYVIEINARLSRSSALASKATGYPLAYIAAKLAIGYTLSEIKNKVTKVTLSCFEPALDYIVIKVPKWEMRKFEEVEKQIGPQMKSIGEAMAIGRRFEEALQKAVRMLEIGRELIEEDESDIKKIKSELKEPDDQRLFAIVDAIRAGLSINEINALSGVDPWFLYKIMNLVEIYKKLKKIRFSDPNFKEELKNAKEFGFSDFQIAELLGTSGDKIRFLRNHLGIMPVVKQIDTLAAEYPAKTNYLYLTYNGSTDDIKFKEKAKIIVIGAGPIRIGSSVEFDWCTMNCVWELKEKGYNTVVVNCNPETVSTDYDMSDKLYFEELTLERILDIIDKEKPLGVVVSVGGQTSNNLAYSLSKRGVKLLGTFGSDIDSAEDRRKFSFILDKLEIAQPPWNSFATLQGASSFAEKVGYPVIVRPSYVLSGSAMKIARNEAELRKYLRKAVALSRDHPVVISKFIENAREVEVDGVGDGGDAFIGAVIEHIENAGVHSGDATMVIPALGIDRSIKEKIITDAKKIARELGVKGPFNMQFIVKDDRIYVIECNLRASRSMPYTSKTIGINLIKLAARCMTGEPLSKNLQTTEPRFFSVKMPMFSWSRFKGTDPILGVEMKSTGEIACMGSTLEEAFLKAITATESGIAFKGKALISGIDNPFKESLQNLGFDLISEQSMPDLVVDLSEEGEARKKFAQFGVPIITDRNLLNIFIQSLEKKPALYAREIKKYWRLSGMHTELKVSKIESGTVIDHLSPNKSYDIIEALRIKEKYPNSIVTMATNVKSNRYGLKDLLKIEGKILSAKEIKIVKNIAGRGTINVIKDYEVIKKIMI
jgi:carbamoyl-phosphate synthase large subunit